MVWKLSPQSHQLPLVGLGELARRFFCRLDLKEPPTAVGGIRGTAAWLLEKQQ
jgi:hypothetical protein